MACAALLGACEKKTEEVVVPAATPAPLSKEDLAKMGSKPRRNSGETGASLSTAAPAGDTTTSAAKEEKLVAPADSTPTP